MSYHKSVSMKDDQHRIHAPKVQRNSKPLPLKLEAYGPQSINILYYKNSNSKHYSGCCQLL